MRRPLKGWKKRERTQNVSVTYPSTSGRGEGAPELVTQRRGVHRVRPGEPGAPGAGHDEDRRATVVGMGTPLDQAVRFHALHETAEPGLAVARVHQLLERAERKPAAGLGAC